MVIAVAAGGAGGATRPATDISTDFRYHSGQDGQDLSGYLNQFDAGPGGGGGGGLAGGQGGQGGSGYPRVGGSAGSNGTSLGDVVNQPVARLPFTNAFYPGSDVAVGGQGQGIAQSGGNGFIALEYQTGGGGYVKYNDEWKPVQTTYVKYDGNWTSVQTTYVNENGIWKPIQGVPVPQFTQFYGAFGPVSRSFGSRLTPPPPPPPTYSDYSGYSGYGSSDMF